MRPALVVACRDHGTPDEPVGLDPPTTSPPVGIPTLKPGRSAPHVKRRLFLHPGTVLRTQSPTDTVRAAGPAPAARLLLRYRDDALSLDVRRAPDLATREPSAAESRPHPRHRDSACSTHVQRRASRVRERRVGAPLAPLAAAPLPAAVRPCCTIRPAVAAHVDAQRPRHEDRTPAQVARPVAG